MLSMSGKDKKTLDLSAVIQIDSRPSRETKPKVSRRPTYLGSTYISSRLVCLYRSIVHNLIDLEQKIIDYTIKLSAVCDN